MDLFGDLPEPDSKGSLYDDIPVQPGRDEDDDSKQNSERKGQELESPIPDGTTNTSIVTSSERGAKRPAEDTCNSCRNSTEKKQCLVKYRLKGYVAERQGEREGMEDAHVIIDDFTPQMENLHPSIYRLAVYAVYDGHGGARASRFASEHLHKNLRDLFPKGDIVQVEKEIKKCLIDAFKKTDEAFLKEASKCKPVWKDGTTVAFVIVINETVYSTNLGDSQVFLCRKKEELGKCVAIPLTIEHNPSAYQERIRIQKAGGNVRDGRVMGVLEVSRSIGDGQYKKLGVSCTPDIKKCQLTDGDRYLVIACDGLWKSLNPEECIKLVNSHLENEELLGTDTKTTEDVRYETACSKLANTAVLRLSSDNVTVLLISIDQTS